MTHQLRASLSLPNAPVDFVAGAYSVVAGERDKCRAWAARWKRVSCTAVAACTCVLVAEGPARLSAPQRCLRPRSSLPVHVGPQVTCFLLASSATHVAGGTSARGVLLQAVSPQDTSCRSSQATARPDPPWHPAPWSWVALAPSGRYAAHAGWRTFAL